MKKIKYLLLIPILILSVVFCQKAFSAEKIHFNGSDFYLVYSTKTVANKNETSGYFNEYIKQGQTVKNWDEIIVIHDFPKATSAQVEAKKLAGMVGLIYWKDKKNPPIAVANNEKLQSSIVDFMIPVADKQTKKLKCLEFNAFKYQKSDKKGVVAFQYSKRFFPKDMSDKTKFQENLINTRKTILPAVAEAKIPKVVEKEIK